MAAFAGDETFERAEMGSWVPPYLMELGSSLSSCGPYRWDRHDAVPSAAASLAAVADANADSEFMVNL